MTARFLMMTALAAAFTLPVHAQLMDDHSMHHVEGSDKKAPPSTAEYEAVMAKMHKDMAIPYTGDADVDFVRGMIPHHQAAIDMAKIQLHYGKDADIRKLSREVIKAQEEEIKEMQKWLKAHDVKK